MTSTVGKKVQIVVGGKCWRVELYHEDSCTEFVVRGPWSLSQTAYKPAGGLRFIRGHHTCWKEVQGRPMDTNTNKSRKNKPGDPDSKNMPDWKPFREAYLEAIK